MARKPADSDTAAPSEAELQRRLDEASAQVGALVKRLGGSADSVSLWSFEKELLVVLWAVARGALVLFLFVREEWVMARRVDGVEVGGRRYVRGRRQERALTTLFGVIRYWRTYLRQVGGGAGYHPLDVAVGLSADRVSWSVFSLSARLATKMSFAEVRSTLGLFVPDVPSTEVIEQAVLGLGGYSQAWFRDRPAPEGDGEVLIVMIDSKGVPTATDSELSRRRGPRPKRRRAPSARHRGRYRRARHPKRPRRKKGDKSKNARLATVVVMYTLERRGKLLLGPLNRLVYASFAPKRHCFEFARREAEKRGFTAASGKLIQVVTDGDDDLAVYARDIFPHAIHTIDVIHVVERLWAAGESLYREGSKELHEWIDKQRENLYRDRVNLVLDELRTRLRAVPKTGPGAKGRRERLSSTIGYIEKRKDLMNYGRLMQRDLEIATGPAEGAVKFVVGRRCDHGGMRWIRERGEALLQLRCIEINGDWDQFMQHVHDTQQQKSLAECSRFRLQNREPGRLPELEAA